MIGWSQLGTVETIYEEEDGDDDSFSSSSSFLSRKDLPSPHSSLRRQVESWSSISGRKPDVLIYVHQACFHVHKDPLTSRSKYLRHHLMGHSAFTLSPSLNITPVTFSLVASFCYGRHAPLTPSNVAALRIAAELLEMTTDERESFECDETNLKEITEAYFEETIYLDQECAYVIFQSCLELLPESESSASLLSRCIVALNLTEYSKDVERFVDDVLLLPEEHFKMVTMLLNSSLRCHDLLYKIINIYIKEHEDNITEEEKSIICRTIDCTKLSQAVLLHAVQNHKMPLRFIVRAMVVEQLNTRRSFLSATSNRNLTSTVATSIGTGEVATLGVLLQRDAARVEAANLKAVMDSTNSRIESLCEEFKIMKEILVQENPTMSRSIMDSQRSSSFHYPINNKIEKGEKKSSSLRFFGKMVSSSLDRPRIENPKTKKNIGKKFIDGLKNVFLVSKPVTKAKGGKTENHSALS